MEAISVLTSSSIFTRSPVTHVFPGLAVVPYEPLPAPTRVVVNPIIAGSSIHARSCCAIIIIGLTVAAREAKWTCTGVRIYIVFAGSTVLAGVGQTLIDILLAVLPIKPWHTNTAVVPNTVQASPSIDTWVREAVVSV